MGWLRLPQGKGMNVLLSHGDSSGLQLDCLFQCKLELCPKTTACNPFCPMGLDCSGQGNAHGVIQIYSEVLFIHY